MRKGGLGGGDTKGRTWGLRFRTGGESRSNSTGGGGAEEGSSCNGGGCHSNCWGLRSEEEEELLGFGRGIGGSLSPSRLRWGSS